MGDWKQVRVIVANGDENLDAIGEFDAWVDGSTWNGWSVPYFTLEEGRRVAEWIRQLAAQSPDPEAQDLVRWDEDAEAFVLESRAYPDEPETDVIEGTLIEGVGQTLYAIGAYRWCWEPVVTSIV